MNEIIETYWNVNDVLLADIVRLIQEIIETYWNVNSDTAVKFVEFLEEIIETYWNVNKLHYEALAEKDKK